jgi:hypothetical protein
VLLALVLLDGDLDPQRREKSRERSLVLLELVSVPWRALHLEGHLALSLAWPWAQLSAQWRPESKIFPWGQRCRLLHILEFTKPRAYAMKLRC